MSKAIKSFASAVAEAESRGWWDPGESTSDDDGPNSSDAWSDKIDALQAALIKRDETTIVRMSQEFLSAAYAIVEMFSEGDDGDNADATWGISVGKSVIRAIKSLGLA